MSAALLLPPGWRQTDGLFVSPHPPEGDPTYSDELRAWIAGVEPRHFWFTCRAALLARAVERFVPADGFLELGCGNGFVLAEISRRYKGAYFGQEVSTTALEMARLRTGAPLFFCRPDEVPLRDLGGVGLFDVIEHVADDVQALQTAASYVRPGGVVLITVPAHRWLWSGIDEASGHHRRYTKAALIGAMSAANLTVEWCRPLFLSTLPGFAIRWTIRAPSRDELLRRALAVPSPGLNRLFRWITQAEAAAALNGMLPAGSSWLALGRVSGH